jgi:hypothetical protein
MRDKNDNSPSPVVTMSSTAKTNAGQLQRRQAFLDLSSIAMAAKLAPKPHRMTTRPDPG